MKTIATATVLMMLTTAAWADEAQNEQANDPSNSDEPIVLSEAEMDGVTAGYKLAPCVIKSWSTGGLTDELPTNTSSNFVTVYSDLNLNGQ